MAHSVKSYIKPLIGSALVGSSLFQLALPLLAQTATTAGENITNKATATYSDGTNTFNATSNEVVIKVAEVAGLTVQFAGFNDRNNGAIIQNDYVEYYYIVTNTGNADRYIFVPGAQDANDSSQKYIEVIGGDISNIPGDNLGDPDKAKGVEIVEFNGVAITPVEVPDVDATDATTINNNSTEILLGTENGKLKPGETMKVKVVVQVTANTAGDPVSVRFGNTTDNPPGDNNQQNIIDVDASGDNASNLDDIRTIDTNGDEAAVNGEREAADFHQEEVATARDPVALATILKSSKLVVVDPTIPDPNTDTSDDTNSSAKDDKIEYRLDFKVANSTLASGIQTDDLEGTSINISDGAATPTITQETKVLISDAIPENTVIDPSSLANEVTVNSDVWETVYTTDDLTTDPLSANWIKLADKIIEDDGSVTTGTPASTVTRIGFIPKAETVFAKGYDSTTDTNGFAFTVIASDMPTAGGKVANIAQIFGTSASDPTDKIVYDESGDQNPNNFINDTTPPATGATDSYDPTLDFGVADVGDPDPGNNRGTTEKGESNVVTINAVVATAGAIKNGPEGVPTASGYNDDNDDFQNKSTPIDPGVPQTTDIDPEEITFNNTLLATNAPLSKVVIRPISSGEADTATSSTDRYQVDNTEIPDGTKVTIEYNDQSVIYTYDANNDVFNVDNGNSSGTNLNGNQAVVIQTLAQGVASQQDYTVKVDLPADTPQVKAFSIPVVAYVDNDSNDSFEPATETFNNITINRVYTGYLELKKEARILNEDGSVASSYAQIKTLLEDGDATTYPSIQPGQTIQYRITYTNISTPTAGDSIALDAKDVEVVEDGTDGSVGNNWALDNDTNGEIDTTHVADSAAYSGGTVTMELYSGNPATGSTLNSNDDVTKYVNKVDVLAPGSTRIFTFKRKVN